MKIQYHNSKILNGHKYKNKWRFLISKRLIRVKYYLDLTPK